MAPITTTIDVARPADAVFEYVTDPTRFPEWQNGVLDGRLDGQPPQGPGERCLTTRRIGGATRTVTSEVTHIEPPRTWAGSRHRARTWAQGRQLHRRTDLSPEAQLPPLSPDPRFGGSPELVKSMMISVSCW